MKRFILLIMAILLTALMLLLGGCTESEPPIEENEVLTIFADGATGFSVVRGDLASDDVIRAAVRLKIALHQAAGFDIKIYTDWDYREDNAGLSEILIGPTNRPETEAAVAGLAENTFVIKVVDGKLVIVGDSTESTSVAVDYFIANYLCAEGNTEPQPVERLSLDLNLNYTGTYTPPPPPVPEVPVYERDELNIEVLEAMFNGSEMKYTNLTAGLGTEFGMHFVDMLVYDGEIWAYYIKWEADPDGNSEAGIALAKSTDGTSFTDYGTVLRPTEGAWDCSMASFPGIWYDDGTFYLVYEGTGTNRGAIGLATSTDGMNFTKKGKILDYTHNGSGLYGANIGTPDLMKVGDTWYLSYHTFNWKDCMICVAIGKDLMNLKHNTANPVIPTSLNGDDSGTTGRRDVLYCDGWFYMVYEISTDQPYDSARWCHQYARSRDFVNWEIIGHIYPTTQQGFGNDGPAWLVIDGEIWVYFRAQGTTRYKLQVADVAD